ncbi:hypothetical protein CAOG_04808 [Capsaspora owczarzaki ATCC 30864]|uniref:Myb-like domain-containing protein n=1 Tax=Capsaspora owczarzaki (strain ATCC 30864) TaxID=595528 RepID=A0A0D2WQV4_CAPO3|nr:hypothetical protein CAOG_04808 [Capsaspora owczarzaki ATCC 30864]KJE94120.1 hypothetical protein CAOG_004808 [Capsaspora owczarzaki ATCC 30864]|eukprot:XP_004347559.2 hypothetical protein CAOG_04808 [Capsaspora owczarzaki ATCC 30864]
MRRSAAGEGGAGGTASPFAAVTFIRAPSSRSSSSTSRSGGADGSDSAGAVQSSMRSSFTLLPTQGAAGLRQARRPILQDPAREVAAAAAASASTAAAGTPAQNFGGKLLETLSQPQKPQRASRARKPAPRQVRPAVPDEQPAGTGNQEPSRKRARLTNANHSSTQPGAHAPPNTAASTAGVGVWHTQAASSVEAIPWSQFAVPNRRGNHSQPKRVQEHASASDLEDSLKEVDSGHFLDRNFDEDDEDNDIDYHPSESEDDQELDLTDCLEPEDLLVIPQHVRSGLASATLLANSGAAQQPMGQPGAVFGGQLRSDQIPRTRPPSPLAISVYPAHYQYGGNAGDTRDGMAPTSERLAELSALTSSNHLVQDTFALSSSGLLPPASHTEGGGMHNDMLAVQDVSSTNVATYDAQPSMLSNQAFSVTSSQALHSWLELMGQEAHMGQRTRSHRNPTTNLFELETAAVVDSTTNHSDTNGAEDTDYRQFLSCLDRGEPLADDDDDDDEDFASNWINLDPLSLNFLTGADSSLPVLTKPPSSNEPLVLPATTLMDDIFSSSSTGPAVVQPAQPASIAIPSMQRVGPPAPPAHVLQPLVEPAPHAPALVFHTAPAPTVTTPVKEVKLGRMRAQPRSIPAYVSMWNAQTYVATGSHEQYLAMLSRIRQQYRQHVQSLIQSLILYSSDPAFQSAAEAVRGMLAQIIEQSPDLFGYPRIWAVPILKRLLVWPLWLDTEALDPNSADNPFRVTGPSTARLNVHAGPQRRVLLISAFVLGHVLFFTDYLERWIMPLCDLDPRLSALTGDRASGDEADSDGEDSHLNSARLKFTLGEDVLLAMGVLQLCDQTTAITNRAVNWPAVSFYFVPGKTPRQLQMRFKNRQARVFHHTAKTPNPIQLLAQSSNAWSKLVSTVNGLISQAPEPIYPSESKAMSGLKDALTYRYSLGYKRASSVTPADPQRSASVAPSPWHLAPASSQFHAQAHALLALSSWEPASSSTAAAPPAAPRGRQANGPPVASQRKKSPSSKPPRAPKNAAPQPATASHLAAAASPAAAPRKSLQKAASASPAVVVAAASSVGIPPVPVVQSQQEFEHAHLDASSDEEDNGHPRQRTPMVETVRETYALQDTPERETGESARLQLQGGSAGMRVARSARKLNADAADDSVASVTTTATTAHSLSPPRPSPPRTMRSVQRVDTAHTPALAALSELSTAASASLTANELHRTSPAGAMQESTPPARTSPRLADRQLRRVNPAAFTPKTSSPMPLSSSDTSVKSPAAAAAAAATTVQWSKDESRQILKAAQESTTGLGTETWLRLINEGKIVGKTVQQIEEHFSVLWKKIVNLN